MGRIRVRAGLMTLIVCVTVGCESGSIEPGPLEPELEGVDLQLVAQGLASPVALTEPPDGSRRLFVVDQVGRVRIVDAGGQLLATPFLDIASRMVSLSTGGDERGLLGLAFHPQYTTNRRFYVYYSAPRRTGAPTNFSHTNQVTEFTTLASDPNRADPASERIVLQVDWPQSNHDGGTVAFGPDGMLYISMGDGGGGGDTGTGHSVGGNGQDARNLLGSILRIDVNGTPYTVPPTNPFVGRTDGLGEIWAYGLRNPYRFSFDRTTGDLIAGDVGQGRWEEVDRIVRGGNYGWNIREGMECFQPATACGNVGRLGEPLIDPVFAYPNRAQSSAPISGVAVIGGFVYRGDAVPGLHGRYVFGDFSGPQGGLLLEAIPSATGSWTVERLELPNRSGGLLGHPFLKGLGEGRDGAIYVLTTDVAGPSGSSGRVYRIIAPTP
jgi:glucose/arabinose dehydrogenase